MENLTVVLPLNKKDIFRILLLKHRQVLLQNYVRIEDSNGP